MVWLRLRQCPFITGSGRARRFRDAAHFHTRATASSWSVHTRPGSESRNVLRFTREEARFCSSPTDFRPFCAPVILVDNHGVSYTKSADWTQLPEQEPPKFSR